MRSSSCLGYDTLGCSASLSLCRPMVKSPEGKGRCHGRVSPYNSLEVDQPALKQFKGGDRS
jgi:hypothetical protein